MTKKPASKNWSRRDWSKRDWSKRDWSRRDWFRRDWSRRDFLTFISASSVIPMLPSCTRKPYAGKKDKKSSLFATRIEELKSEELKGKEKELKRATRKDEVILSNGLNYEIIIKEGDVIGSDIAFGTNNDYLNFYTFKNGRTALWCNHENIHPLLVHNRKLDRPPTPTELKHEREQVGGSFVEVTKNDHTGKWTLVQNSKLNFRLSANTPIPLSKPLLGKRLALGTVANCSGGHTPWGTILTCEENYQHFYGEKEDGKIIISKDYDLKWMEVEPQPAEHYGWVVEIDPAKKSAQKLVSLGRFSHECATVVMNSKGYPVVYSGDDAKNECLYKFVSKNKKSLKEGTLYVANLKRGEWISLDYESSNLLKKNFKDQTDVMINCRKAAKLLGGTPLDRPEDIEQDPLTKDIFVTLTNNKPKGNYHGSILKIIESDKSYKSDESDESDESNKTNESNKSDKSHKTNKIDESNKSDKSHKTNKINESDKIDESDLSFKHSTFRVGGTETGFSCPDNIAFDQNGNLWLTSDISGGGIGKKPYANFGNNSLFVIPRSGPQAGQVLKVGSAPVDAEFTGPFFSTDQKTLFLSVQHPGEKTKDLNNMTSHWPSGNKSKKPLSSVIAIQGPLLDDLTQR